ERKPEREAEELRLVRDRLVRVDDDERNGAGRGRAEEREDEELGARRGWLERHDPLRPLDARRPAAAAEQQDERRDEPAPGRAHAWILRPMTVQTPTSAAPAKSQATSPSGTGPMWPIPQPPRSSGCFAHST